MTDMPSPLTAEGIAQFCEDRTGVRPRVEGTSADGFQLYTDPSTAMDAVIRDWYSELLAQGAVSHTTDDDDADPPFVDIPPESS